VRHAHPVKRTITCGFGRIQIIVSVHIEHTDRIRRDATQSGDHTKCNGAIATQDEQCVAAYQRRGEALDQVLNGLGHLIDILRSRIDAIRTPDLNG